MPTPFPGMDPYLERPGLRERVHIRLLVAMADVLAPRLRPRYYVDVETRTYLTLNPPNDLVGIPDVVIFQPVGTAPTQTAPTYMNGDSPLLAEIPMPEEVTERFLAIREVQSNEVITVIELLSPVNKSNVTGREQYNEKRQEILASRTNLIEIDLLRGGQAPPIHWRTDPHCDYRMIISRSWQRPTIEVYHCTIRQPIPTIPVPLRRHENEPELELNQLVHALYDRAGYDLMIDYRQPTTPPLREDDAVWADQLLRSAGLR